MAVGFRMKFQPQHDLEEFIKNYSELFQRYEIKVTSAFEDEEFVREILDLSYKYLNTEFSLHLPKNILADEDELKMCEVLFRVLKQEEYEGLLITHMPEDISIMGYAQRIKQLSDKVPGHLLLENTVITGNILEYLKNANTFFEYTNTLQLDNIGFCLDLGHLLFSYQLEGLSQERAISELEQCPFLITNMQEIHMHDFNDSSDHLQLGEGLMDLSVISKFITDNHADCPMVIETNVKNPRIDGLGQVKLLSDNQVG